MTVRNRIRAGAGAVYAVALVIGLIAGGFVWIAIVGAIVLSMVYTSLRGPGGADRVRNRNRNR